MKNVENALNHIGTAKANSADIAVLPEIFNCPYGKGKTNIFSSFVSSVHNSYVPQEKNRTMNLVY